ncbi:MAG: hypothetical protein GKS00_29245 [Alphaproteobacteria bacterium]|nr:hypothetical protein [Alphaproteobacteria bacterium]
MSETYIGGGCLWPMWSHSATPDHKYCGKKRQDGQSYCSQHYARSIRNPEDQPEVFVPRKIAA